jgi:hypothetical protein
MEKYHKGSGAMPKSITSTPSSVIAFLAASAKAGELGLGSKASATFFIWG